jgi:hypothetical protein
VIRFANLMSLVLLRKYKVGYFLNRVVCHRESWITVSSGCPDTFDQILYIIASNASSCGLLIPLSQITQKVWRNLLPNFVYSEEYDSDEDGALQSKYNFNLASYHDGSL